jgi:type IV secretory pathway TraG/TraD family ATPase VirD4
LFHIGHHREYFDGLHFLIVWFFTTLVLALFLWIWLLSRKPKAKPTKIKRIARNLNSSHPNFRLWLGESTGHLSSLHHSVGIVAKQAVTLSLEDAAQNILILGAIGSGKTTRAIHPLLIQCLDQSCGGLIFDIKGDFKKAVYLIAEKTNQPVITLGPHQQPLDLLLGLTPEMAASFFKSVFILSSRTSLDSFWIDTATELCRNSLGVLSFFPKRYSLQGLYQYIFDPRVRDNINYQAGGLLATLNVEQQSLLKSYLAYYESIYLQFEEKIKSNVNATMAQVLSPFNHPALVDAFCTADEKGTHLQSVLDGGIFLVDMPLSTWGLGGKVAYTFIKLRFFNVMQQRITQQGWNQVRPVFFLCDEFQEIVSANRDGLSDLNFWDKSRSSNTIGIVSAQSISSFYAAIGDRDIANALLQNFRQKICFKTEDQTTLDSFNRLLGRIEKARRSYSHQEGSSSVPERVKNSRHKSSTESLTYVDQSLIDAQLFRQLGQNQALAILSLQGNSTDDVLNMMPVFV